MIRPIADDGQADTVTVPENPTAQNAATEALKKKTPTTITDTAPALPGIGPSQTTPAGSPGASNPDPNAYATPPQATDTAVPANSVPMVNNAPLAPPSAPPSAPPMPGISNTPASPAVGPSASPPIPANAPPGWSWGEKLSESNGTTRFQNGQIDAQTPEQERAKALAYAEQQARERQMQKDDARIATEAQKAMFTTKADGGNAFGDYVAGLTPEQRQRLGVREESVTPQQRAASGLPQLEQAVVPPVPPPVTPPAAPSTPQPSPAPAPAPSPAPAPMPSPAPTAPAPAPSLPTQTASGMGNVAQTAVTPENALTNSMLSRAPGADRFKIAQDQWEAFQKATNPAYEAATRDAMRKAAAGGALGSGELQTSLGDLAQQRALALDTQKQNFLSEALKGNIEDQFRDLGVAQQQQGFQQGQQQQAFGNAVTQQNLQEALTSGAFNRSLQQLLAGSSGNPADTALMLSQIFGNQASGAGGSLAALLGGMGQKSTQGQPLTTDSLMQLLYGVGDTEPTMQVPTLTAPTLSSGLPTGQAIGGGTGSTSPFAFTG